jgi:NADPH:quinone reductase-like Zn-dependent oxidoreductase
MVVMGDASGAPLALDEGQVERFFSAPAPNQPLHALNIGGWFLERPGRSAALLEELVGHVLAGRVRAEPGARVPLTEAASAHARLGAREALGKIVLTP